MSVPLEAGATPVAFDPVADSFIAQDERPAGLLPIDVSALSPYQRSLLVIDGTVTRFIEAYWLEAVRVQRIAQEELRLAADERWLGLAAGTPVIRRQVLLLGRDSGRLFAWADTLLAVARLQGGLRQGLERDDGGLGRILIDTGAETRREGLWCGCEQPRGLPAAVAGLHAGRWLVRSYRVIAQGQALMRITERFPLG